MPPARAKAAASPDMSLLLDALKKTGQAKQDDMPGDSINVSTPELARSTGHNLFAAKTAPMHNRARVGIIPLALISGFLLAAIGGYYVWHETSSTPPMPQHIAAAASIKQPATTLAMETKAAPTVVNVGQGGTQSVGAVAAKPHSPKPLRLTANKPAQGVIIEHGQTTDTVNATLTSAYHAYGNGDYATAWQLYRSVLQQDARNRDALLGMAAIAQQQGQDAVAAQYYGQVLTLDPRDPAAHAGMSALTSGDAASTESRLKQLLTHRPDAAPLHFALGNLYAAQSRWGEAQQSYFNATNREPDNSQYAFNLAVSLDHLSQKKLATQYYQRALQLDQPGRASFDHAQTQQRVNELTTP